MSRVALAAALCVTPACGDSSLDGNWDGFVTCGEDDDHVAFTILENDGLNFIGSGRWQTLCSIPAPDGAFEDGCDLTFDISIIKKHKRGSQEVIIDMERCAYDYEGDTLDTECPTNFDDEQWDGKNLLDGEVTPEACDFAFQRGPEE